MTDRYPTDKSAHEREEGINSSIPSRFLFSVSLYYDSASNLLRDRKEKEKKNCWIVLSLSPVQINASFCCLTVQLMINTESIFTL